MGIAEGGNILIVDDTPENLSVLRQILTREGHRVRPALSGEIALKTVQAELPDLILLDILMPGMDGYQVCQRLKASESTRDIPIIFISALNDIDDKMKAFSAGCVDYISKPFQSEEILARVHTHLALRRQQEVLALQNRQLQEKNALISEQAARLRDLASRDSLTGLSNRREFLEKARAEHKRFERNGRPFAVVLLDIDHFKKVNDTHGHDCGDAVLTGVARTLERNLRQQDVVARWGGEEFICLLPETDLAGARKAAEKLRLGLAGATHSCAGAEVSLTATLGVSMLDGVDSLEECIKRADRALYRGKRQGRNQVICDQ